MPAPAAEIIESASFELLATVATQGMKHIAREALGMDTKTSAEQNGHRP